MALVDTINNSKQLEDMFQRMGRQADFSRNGLRALFDYLESLSDDLGENIEVDVIALCCEYAETTWNDFKLDYPDIDSIEKLQDIATVIMVDDSVSDNPTFIYQVF